KTLHAIYENDQKIYVVGENGTILSLENNSLVSMESPTTNHLNALWQNDNRLYAAGNDGTILSYPLPECQNGYTESDIASAQQYALSLAEARAFSEYHQVLEQKAMMISNQNQLIASQNDQIQNMFTQSEMNDAIALSASEAVSQAVAEKNDQIDQLSQLIMTLYTQTEVNQLIEQVTSVMYSQQEMDLAIENALFVKNEEIAQYLERIDALNKLLASKNLDIDCNGHADALTDGLLIIRYLFNLNQGGSFTQNAVDLINGTCVTEEKLRQNIQNLLP
ncbi:hypothetical protein MHK_002483, partial [Candidatus Magnetomorum sp. HK-1]